MDKELGDIKMGRYRLLSSLVGIAALIAFATSGLVYVDNTLEAKVEKAQQVTMSLVLAKLEVMRNDVMHIKEDIQDIKQLMEAP